LKFGQVVVAEQGIPVVTAAHFQSAEQVATMVLELLRYNRDGNTLCVQADLGLAIGHILAVQVWAVYHT
jgi:hypothetical protein